MTKFKIAMEYIIIGILVVSILLLKNIKKEEMKHFITSIKITILSELMFTIYTDVYGVSNMLGHLLKLISFYYMYKFVMLNLIELPQKELSEANKEIANLDNMNEKIINSINDSLFIVNRSGDILYTNLYALETLEYSKEEFLGRNLRDIDTEENMKKIEDRMKGIIENGKAEFETTHISKTGKIIPMEVKANIIKYENDNNILSICRDLTDRKNYESNILKSKEEAEKANRAKSEFLSNMSHEIRTPMNGIFGFLQILSELETDEEKKEYLRMINESAEYLLDIINEILSLSKIEAGKCEIRYERVNLYNKIKLFTRSHEVIANKKELFFQINIDKGIDKEILIDYNPVLKILNNLLSNAIKFTKQGGIELIVENREKEKIEITVKDTGIGINEKKQKSLYAPFEQGEYYLSKEYGGTGLGLAIVKKLVDLLCGEIEMTTEIGKGTEFKLIIPYKEVENKLLESKEKVEINKVNGKARVISAEDVEINQKLLEKMLSSNEILFKKVYTGKELIDELENEKYDLILMDIQLPIINGLEATKIIRESEKYKNIPIIAVSAYALEENIEEMYKAGVNDHIAKPIRKEELINKINKWLPK